MLEGFKTLWITLYYATIGLFTGLPKLVFWPFKVGYAWATRKDGVHGNAHWASKREIAKAGRYGDGLILGEAYGKLVRLSEPLHVLVLGATGSGKTRGNFVPNLLEMQERGLLIVDPKAGELEQLTGGHRMKHGAVEVIRLNDPLNSLKYDALAAIKRAGEYEYEEEIRALCELLIPVKKQDGVEAHFRSFGQKLIAASINYHVHTKKEKAALPECITAITGTKGTQLKTMLFEWAAAVGNDDIMRAAAKAFDEISDKERSGLGTTLANMVEPYIGKSARAILTADGMDWQSYLNKSVSIYLQYPIHKDEQYGAMVRLIVGQCCGAIMEEVSQKGKLKVPFTIMIDEAARMGYCKPLAKAITYLRGANANLMCAFQSPNQIKDVYPDPLTLMDGCDSWVVSRIGKNIDFARQISDIIGDYTIESGSRSTGKNGKSESKSEAVRKLVKPEELRQLKDDQCIILTGALVIDGKKPFDFKRRDMRKKIIQGKARKEQVYKNKLFER